MATVSNIGVGATNITTLGTIGTGVWQGTPVALTYFGTGNALTASNGGIVWSDATKLNILSGTATANQVLLSGASATPAWSTATYPATTTISQLLYSSATNTITGLATANSAVLCTTGAGVPTWIGPLNDGQIIIGGSSVTPAAANITAGAGITITNGVNAITITAGVIVNQNSSSVTMVAGRTYQINNGASLVTLTLPASPTAGDVFYIQGFSSGGWTVAQNASQLVRLPGGVVTTTGTGGSISSSSQYDCISIIFTQAANTFNAFNVVGVVTYV